MCGGGSGSGWVLKATVGLCFDPNHDLGFTSRLGPDMRKVKKNIHGRVYGECKISPNLKFNISTLMSGL